MPAARNVNPTKKMAAELALPPQIWAHVTLEIPHLYGAALYTAIWLFNPYVPARADPPTDVESDAQRLINAKNRV